MTSPTTPEAPKRTGLTLSGGGFRATLFHLGVVRFLYEEKKLKDVTHICSVSGGSILAAHLVLNWERYTGTPEEFDAAAGELLACVRSDLRGRVVRPWLFSWAALSLPRRLQKGKWWRTSLLQKEYDRLLKGAKLKDLVAPGRPELHILATSFTTGHLVAFGNRRVQFVDDPLTPPEARHQPPEVPAETVPVALAVAASSAFPPMFPPVRVSYKTFGQDRNLLPHSHSLTDGGVFDNLGIRRLLWLFKPQERLDMIIVSDAQRSLTHEYENEYNLVLGRTSRCVDLMMTRVSVFESASAESVIHRDHGHLHRCRLTDLVLDRPYALSAADQSAVHTARTDLDVFSDDEIDAIIHHGYAVARASAEADPEVPDPVPPGGKVWTPARPDRTGGYAIADIGRRRLGLFRAGHWATWALFGLVALWAAIPLGLYLYQYYRAAEQRRLKDVAEGRILATERAAKYVKAVRMLGEVVLSGNEESARRRKVEWFKFREELAKDQAFTDFLASPELLAVEGVIQKPDWPPPPGATGLVLKLAKKVRTDLEHTGGEEYIAFQRENRRQLYDEVREAVEQIANPDKPKLDQVPNSRRQFWRLYWGPMALFEGQDVERAMVAFGDVLREWEDSKGDAPAGKPELRKAEGDLKDAIKRELLQ